MRSYTSLSELGFVKSTPVPLNVIVNGRAKFITAPLSGGPVDLDDETAMAEWIASKGTVDCRIKGTLATGVNSKGKPVVPVSAIDIKGTVLASLLPWEADRFARETADRLAAEQLAAETAASEPSETVPAESNRLTETETAGNGRKPSRR